MATYNEMINKLTPQQVDEMFTQGYPTDLPQRMSFLDYINPKSYIDPLAANRVVPQNTVAPSPVTNSTPSLSNLTNYIPSASTIGEYIPTSLPNVFGVNNPLYAGLLGADQSQALSKQSNVAGLLGAAAALVQGMGSQGPRRSATQNILAALGAGYGASGQAYQGGIEQMANAQKLAQMKLQMQQSAQTKAAVDALRLDPNIDEATKTALLIDPAGTIKNLSELRQFQNLRGQYMPQGAAAPTVTAGQIEGQVLQEQSAGGKSEISQLETMRNGFLADAQTYAVLRDPVKAKAALESADKILERQQQVIASDINIKDRINNAPAGFKQQYETIEKLKEGSVLRGKDLLDAIQKVDQAVLESSKQYKFDGIAGNYAVTQFGTNDQTKLTPEQNRNVLAYANAPTQADQTKIAIDAQKLKFETGVGVPMPKSREEMLGGGAIAPSAVITQPTQAAVVQPTQAVVPRAAIPPMAQAPEPRVPANMQRTGEAATKPVVDIGRDIPLINQPDKKIPPKEKQKLLAQKPATIDLVNYSITQLVDARDAAQALLNSPKELQAISGFTGPMMSRAPGTDAYTGAAKLENLQTRSFVSEIQKMRAASPTGGAVGSVTEKEMAALSNIQASLKAGLKEDVLRKQLKQYIDSANRALGSIPKQYARTYGYNGEFDDILKGGVVQQPTTSPLPKGVTVKKVN